MKIFIAHQDPYHAGNPFIYTLMDAIKENYPDTEFGWGGWNIFESDEIFSYDIVHFHWVQNYVNYLPANVAFDRFRNILKRLKDRNIKLVCTCHDLQPHYNDAVEYGSCMTLAYEMSDAIFHLGQYSMEIFKKKYPHVKHYYLPHHIYDTLYSNFPTREEAISKLNFEDSKKYILCFGSFRADEERQMIIQLARLLNDKEVVILAPSFMRVSRHHRPIFKWIPTKSILLEWYYRHRYNIVMSGFTWVPIDDETLPYFYAVADIALVQRLKILNSGNVVMPLLFKKCVVGPNIGNVGPFLKEYGYPTFEVGNIHSVLAAVNAAFKIKESNYPDTNYQKAMDTLSTFTIANKLFDDYKDIIALRIKSW